MDFQNYLTELNGFLLTVQDLPMFVVGTVTSSLSVYGMIVPVWSIALLLLVVGATSNALLVTLQEMRGMRHRVDNTHIEQRYRARMDDMKHLY